MSAISTAYSDFVDIWDEWYTDYTFSNATGHHEKDCDGITDDWGVQSDWRYQVVTGCNTGNQLSGCWHFSGTSWDEVDCPPPMQKGGKLRVPVG